MDAFSQVLSDVRLKGALFFSAELSAPWSFSAPQSTAMASLLMPGAPHLIIYHLVVEGTMRSRLPDGSQMTLAPGDIVVFPHGDAHELGEGGVGTPLQQEAVFNKIATRELSPFHGGGGGSTTRLVCGFLACDPLLCGPILEGLPPMLKVNVRTDRAGHWLEQAILHLVDEATSHNAGSDAMLAKLSEALFVDTLRRYVAALPDQSTGWLAGARDPQVGRSLALLHSRPQHPWTIAELAETVGLSRSTLLERFTRYLSEPPMAYLTGWRLRLAAQALASTSKGVADIAADVGYESEAAFNRAFKRAFGLPPARYRRERRSPATAPREEASPLTVAGTGQR